MIVQVLWALAGIMAGAFIAIQAPINAALGRGLGLPVAGGAVSFAVGAAFLTLVSLTLAGAQHVALDWKAPAAWTFLAGGLLGGSYVTVALLLAPRIGAAATMAFVVTGQLIAGVVLDRLGFLGMAVREITVGRLAGAALLLTGALLVRLT